MDIIILLLVFTQSFSTNIRYSSVQAAHTSAMMGTYFKIKKLSMRSRRTTLIPNHNICGGSGIRLHIITLAFSRSPWWVEFNMRDGKWVKLVENGGGMGKWGGQMCHIPNAYEA